MVLLNLLGAVHLCKVFLQFITHLGIIIFKVVGFSGLLLQTAAHLTENLKVVFEFFQVRTGKNSLKPLARNGIAAEGTRESVGVEIRQTIALCRSEKGPEKRYNAQAEKLKAEFAETWGRRWEGQERDSWFFRQVYTSNSGVSSYCKL